jgi:putative acetyltransferase
MPAIVLNVEDPGSADARCLIAKLDSYLNGLYPPECNHLMPIELLRQPNVTFLVARVDGAAVGCGGFVRHDADFAELKRMFVLPEFRGLGLGQRILERLEALIRSAGLAIIRLETGVSQRAAVSLYARFGYTVRGPFADYPNDPLSIFMEKALDERKTSASDNGHLEAESG